MKNFYVVPGEIIYKKKSCPNHIYFLCTGKVNYIT